MCLIYFLFFFSNELTWKIALHAHVLAYYGVIMKWHWHDVIFSVARLKPVLQWVAILVN